MSELMTWLNAHQRGITISVFFVGLLVMILVKFDTHKRIKDPRKIIKYIFVFVGISIGFWYIASLFSKSGIFEHVTFKKEKQEPKSYDEFHYPDRVFELQPGQSVEVPFYSGVNYDFISQQPMEVTYRDSIANIPRFIFIARDGKRFKADNIEELPQSFKTIGSGKIRIIKNIGDTTDVLTLSSYRSAIAVR